VANKVWFNPRLPQTLQGVVLFSYLNAGFALLSLLSGWGRGLGFALLVGAVGAYGVANMRRWGYYLCLLVAVIYFLAQLYLFFAYGFVFGSMINLLFSGFLIALVLHPMSRSFQRQYFR